MAFALLGTGFWVMANTVIKISKTNQPFSFIVWSSPISVIVIFFIRYVELGGNQFIDIMKSVDLYSIMPLLFTSYLTALFAYGLWVMLLAKYDLAISAPAYLLVPIFSMIFSHVIFKEPVGLLKMIAIIFIFFGVLVNACGSNVVRYLPRSRLRKRSFSQ